MDERTRLTAHIDTLFQNAGAPGGRAVYELKEELLANSLERYRDLVAGGMDPEAAFNSVASSIGNVDELVAALPADSSMIELQLLYEQQRQRRAIIAAVSVALYVVALAILVLGSALIANWVLPFVGAIVVAIIPTCLLVYSAIAYPKYKKGDDTVVEEFKAYANDAKRNKAIKNSVNSMIWTLTMVLYFLISFTTFAWHITWVIFLVGACLQSAVTLLFSLKGM